jgi:hypothetical protein
MLGLLHFVLAILVLPFRSKGRLEAENAVVCTENLNAGVIVMQSTEERMGVNDSRSLNRARDRRILILIQ